MAAGKIMTAVKINRPKIQVKCKDNTDSQKLVTL